MTAASVPAIPAPARPARSGGLAPVRLFGLELRRSAMLWLVPVAVALFWFDAYRNSMELPAMWNLRAMTMQHGALLDFVPPVAGAAAWTGWRDSRRHLTDLVASTARPRWTAQLTAWAALTVWAMLAYLGCAAVLYAMTARHAGWGGPLWWPVAVGAAGIPAVSAAGFAAGAFLPSRLTTPLVTVAAFFALGLSSEGSHADSSLWQLSPQLTASAGIGPDPGVASFYHYLPDLSIAQTILLAGVTLAVLGALGLPARSGSQRLRCLAAVITAAGVAATATALALAGTGRADPHGMEIIPALHDAANDQPVRYTPACSQTPIAVCLNPAFAAILPMGYLRAGTAADRGGRASRRSCTAQPVSPPSMRWDRSTSVHISVAAGHGSGGGLCSRWGYPACCRVSRAPRLLSLARSSVRTQHSTWWPAWSAAVNRIRHSRPLPPSCSRMRE